MRDQKSTLEAACLAAVVATGWAATDADAGETTPLEVSVSPSTTSLENAYFLFGFNFSSGPFGAIPLGNAPVGTSSFFIDVPLTEMEITETTGLDAFTWSIVGEYVGAAGGLTVGFAPDDAFDPTDEFTDLFPQTEAQVLAYIEGTDTGELEDWYLSTTLNFGMARTQWDETSLLHNFSSPTPNGTASIRIVPTPGSLIAVAPLLLSRRKRS